LMEPGPRLMLAEIRRTAQAPGKERRGKHTTSESFVQNDRPGWRGGDVGLVSRLPPLSPINLEGY